MKAIVRTKYGPPEILQLKEVERPTPADDEVLVKIYAASVNRSDWEMLTGTPYYARVGGRHQILGSDIAGRVEMTGRDATRFRPGDDVFGDNFGHMGGFAEYVCASERSLTHKPTAMTFEQAAAIPQAGVIALQGIRDKGQATAGQKILINGAGGGAGTFAIQLAKSYGAEVTGVDSADKLEFMRSIGADHVIDYSKEDFTKDGRQYDLVLDVIASRSPFACKRALGPNGSYFAVGGPVPIIIQILVLGPLIRLSSGKKITLLAVRPNLEDMIHLAELCEAGKIMPVIDRRFPLSETAEALRYLGEGHVQGKVVITIG